MQDATTTLEEALQFIPMIQGISVLKADVFRSFALSEIAEAQGEAGLEPQSTATFDRAAQASSEVGEAKGTGVGARPRKQRPARHRVV